MALLVAHIGGKGSDSIFGSSAESVGELRLW